MHDYANASGGDVHRYCQLFNQLGITAIAQLVLPRLPLFLSDSRSSEELFPCDSFVLSLGDAVCAESMEIAMSLHDKLGRGSTLSFANHGKMFISNLCFASAGVGDLLPLARRIGKCKKW